MYNFGNIIEKDISLVNSKTDEGRKRMILVQDMLRMNMVI